MALKRIQFAELESGQIFLSKKGSMYRKIDDQSAELVRLPSGDEPDERTVDQFAADQFVERVPPRKE